LLVAILCTGCAHSLAAAPAPVELKLPAVFADNMVMQRDMKLPVWGWAAPGDEVIVIVAGQTARATADAQGQWKLTLAPLKLGDPVELVVKAGKTITLKNVLVGDVWVCSGQSNMAWTVRAANDPEKETAAAKYPNIRLFKIGTRPTLTPQDDVPTSWTECTPETVLNFSAVGYFFGRDLHKHLGVPIGLISSSVGGTPAEAWTPEAALLGNEELAKLVEASRTAARNYPAASEAFKIAKAKWDAKYKFTDPGNTGFDNGLAAADHDDAAWKEMRLPGALHARGLRISGIVWFRKTVTIPPDWAGKPLTLSLGTIDDFDTTYFNGVKVGAVGPKVRNATRRRRAYTVPGKLVKAGRAVITVRVHNMAMAGGFTGRPADMSLVLLDDNAAKPVSLAGAWKRKVTAELAQPAKTPAPPSAPRAPGHAHTPTVLYNGMIHPVVPFGIKGAIWYQGESNGSRAAQYRVLFPAMISGWRKVWGQGDFPFLFVQLANFLPVQTEPVQHDATWPFLREAQTMTLSLPNTGMAVITDVGEARSIHPRNKQTVGARLALAARKIAHGEDIVHSGPIYDKMQRDDDKITLSFTQIGAGLLAKGGPLKGFAIAGANKQFVWATAKIAGDKIIVTSDKVKQPAAVRYNWANNPIGNLYNKEGLPASPFRTDE